MGLSRSPVQQCERQDACFGRLKFFFCGFFFFFKQKTAYEMQRGLVGSEMCIRDRPTSARSLNKMPFIEHVRAGSLKGAKGKVEFISFFQGSQAYAAYTDKLRDPNWNNSRHLLAPGNRMSTTLWESGLRNYSSNRVHV
eukprot:TRINITY_DN60618_c0_g1_i1.p2 TRINITY_DN60618_c0_g1~~TRINITY_DN60618_c0_g1_i1.p2  ORF type:complete len:139 (+),score=18.26 TRINITY_DN60618_c0_g1_i1:47-463(+)